MNYYRLNTLTQRYKDKINLTINYLLMLYAFLLPLSIISIKSIVTILFVLWLLEGNLYEKNKSLMNNKSIVLFFVFILYSIISLFWVDSSIYEAFKFIFQHKYILVFVIIYTSVREENILKLIGFFVAGVFLSEVISYGIFFSLIDMGYSHTNFGTKWDPTPFMDHLDYSIFLALTANILLYKLFHQKNRNIILFQSFFFISSTANLFITGGRIGQIAFFFGLMVAFITRFKKNFIQALVGYLFLSSVIITLAFNSSSLFEQRALNAIDSVSKVFLDENYNSSWGQRIGAWIVSTEIIRNNLFFGVGIKDNLVEFRNTIDSEFPELQLISWFPHLHSQYLEITTSLGVVGLVIFLSIFYAFSKMIIINSELRYLQWLFLSIFFVAFFADLFLEKKWVANLFGFIYGLLLAQYKYEQLRCNHDK